VEVDLAESEGGLKRPEGGLSRRQAWSLSTSASRKVDLGAMLRPHLAGRHAITVRLTRPAPSIRGHAPSPVTRVAAQADHADGDGAAVPSQATGSSLARGRGDVADYVFGFANDFPHGPGSLRRASINQETESATSSHAVSRYGLRPEHPAR
jgi:hypothetical protein